MWTTQRTGIAACLLLFSGLSQGEDAPTAPPGLGDAQTLGLARMGVDDLKSFIPGTIVGTGPAGKEYRMIFDSNGSVLKRSASGRRDRGTWRFDSRRDVYCITFQEEKDRDSGCFAVFRSEDTIHFFDYRINNGHYLRAWRKEVKK